MVCENEKGGLPNREWTRLNTDGAVGKCLRQVGKFFMTDASVTNARLATEYFDPSL
jgi:hypothetical protein